MAVVAKLADPFLRRLNEREAESCSNLEGGSRRWKR
jgi:hypothetical protein